MNEPLPRTIPQVKTGTEPFRIGDRGLGYDLAAFWRWSVSDLVSNATRGRLAEFIVALGLHLPLENTVRDEWGAYDLETRDGIKIEVKSAAYLQSWQQRRESVIEFQTPKTLAWDPDLNQQAKEARRQADVYVFALLKHKDKSSVDPLDLSQWEFYVVPTTFLDQRKRSQHSISLASLKRECLLEFSFDQFEMAVKIARDANKSSKIKVS